MYVFPDHNVDIKNLCDLEGSKRINDVMDMVFA